MALNFTTTQVSTPTGAATQIAPARPGRSAVTVVNITGTFDTFVGPVGTDSTHGCLLVGTKGASLTFDTEAAIYATSPGGAQVLSIAETYS